MFDDLEHFKNWWMTTRIINTPQEAKLDFYGVLHGVVLYRQAPYQVQLFILPPNSEIDPHMHPNVDSFEVFVNGDINFMCNDVWYSQNVIGSCIRVLPSSWHGGKFGERGGCFLSVQKWLNGVEPTSVGEDWHDKNNNIVGTAIETKENYGN
jgi:mannose-6-phosphate isomerase-like protein (cupin superfamily)